MTNSIIRRWYEHSTGQSSYLRRVKPKEVVYVEFYSNYSKAARREHHIKSIGAKKFLLMSKFNGTKLCIDKF